MTIRKIEKIEKLISHPLEEFFDIEPSTTEMTKFIRKTELTEYQNFDDKDKEIEDTYQEIADAAMSGYDNLQEMIDTADTKFAARLAEVSVQHLNAALSAISKRAQLKENKDKLLLRERSGSTKSQTNVFIMDRNEALKSFMQDDDIIDVDYIDNATDGDSE